MDKKELKGYSQAIENLAYYMRIGGEDAAENENIDISSPEAFYESLTPEQREEEIKLSKIVTVISDTYDVDITNVVEDAVYEMNLQDYNV